MRLTANGKPVGRPPMPMAVRFENHVDRNGPTMRPGLTPCWTWTGNHNDGGYGTISAGPPKWWRLLRAHRVSWELHRGTIPDGQMVLHSCDNRSCVNPDHLRIGTFDDNMADLRERGGCKGGRNGQAKLNDAAVIAIRSEASALEDLAARFSVSVATVRDVQARRRWRHVP